MEQFSIKNLTSVNLREIVRALSDMLDLVGVDDFYHGKRVACMAMECMRALHPRGDESLLATTCDAALLHDCGVSSTRIHKKLISELDWADAHIHCERGHQLLAGNRSLAGLAPFILHHHTHWDKLAGMQLSPRIKLISNCIYLADRIDSLTVRHAPHELLLNSDKIRQTIGRYRGTLFAPQLVDIFLFLSQSETFWFTLFPPHIDYYLAEMNIPAQEQRIDHHSLREIASLFADIVDAKSPFTAEHAYGVSHLARYIGELHGLGREECNRLELAGFLHDLGKLKVPDEILEKNGPLNITERAIIMQHSFETFQILRQISGFETIARLAASHHETPSGKGYPFHMHEADLSVEARIISVADVFQALSQNRPYRAAQLPEEIRDVLYGMAGERRLDGTIVSLVADNLRQCFTAAMSYKA
ncbi:MAG: HD domain-containing protein [Deltaproteobacteria bacterium]|nr:HD domain-containing protein [Deltaproteobacteria bacterium]